MPADLTATLWAAGGIDGVGIGAEIEAACFRQKASEAGMSKSWGRAEIGGNWACPPLLPTDAD